MTEPRQSAHRKKLLDAGGFNLSVLLKPGEDAERAHRLKEQYGGTAPMVREALKALEEKNGQNL